MSFRGKVSLSTVVIECKIRPQMHVFSLSHMKTNLSHYSLHGINQNQQSKKNSQNNFETTSVLSNAAAVRCQFKDISNLFPVLQHTYKNAPNYTNSFVLFDNFYCL